MLMFVGRKNILLSSEYQHVVFAATEEELILCERVRLVTVLMFILGAAAATTFRGGLTYIIDLRVLPVLFRRSC